MSHVFISYAREDAVSARRVAEALERAGFSVWWDRQIPPGRSWDDVIGRALDAAVCVVVLWSGVSVVSRWVREEAEKAANRNCLIPVLLERVNPPFGFGRIQAADLSGWAGDEKAPELAALRMAVSDLVREASDGAAVGERTAGQASVSSKRPAGGRRLLWVAGPVVAAFLIVWAVSRWDWSSPSPSEPGAPTKSAPAAQPSPPVTIGRSHVGCEVFQDSEAVVSGGPITEITVYHAGYVHGIRVRYGTGGLGATHGFTAGIPSDDWIVPEGHRIVRVEGELASATSGAGCPVRVEYVSRLQFFTDRGSRSPRFGTAGGEPFVVTVPEHETLKTISGSANLKRHKCFNRALASMTFRFEIQSGTP